MLQFMPNNDQTLKMEILSESSHYIRLVTDQADLTAASDCTASPRFPGNRLIDPLDRQIDDFCSR